MRNFLQLVVFSIFFSTLACSTNAQNKQSLSEQEHYQRAADYSRELRGLSVLIIKGDKVVFEEYQNGHSAEMPHQLASGTKSFTGVVAIMAQEDGLLKLDEKVSDTIAEWKSDKQKSKITIRQLLSLTSGLDGGQIGRPPTYKDALNSPAKLEIGTTFEYGPVPFQIFGEILRRKLAPQKEGVMDYMKRRLFNPIGLKTADWTMQDGQPNLPSGASLTAREWVKFGQFLKNGGKWNGKQLVAKKLLDECFGGSTANANYGLTFWLNRSNNGKANLAEKPKTRIHELFDIQPETDQISREGFGKNLPKDIFVAAGAGKQRLYVIPSLDMVVVRQGEQARFDDGEFLTRLISSDK